MKIRNYCTVIILFSGLVFGSACSNSRETLSEDSSVSGYDTAEDIPGAYNATSTEVLKQKAELREILNQKLDNVDNQIEELEDQSKAMSASAKENYKATIDELDVQRERIVAQYRQLDGATSKSWDNVKEEIDNVMQDVDQKMTNLVADLKQ